MQAHTAHHKGKGTRHQGQRSCLLQNRKRAQVGVPPIKIDVASKERAKSDNFIIFDFWFHHRMRSNSECSEESMTSLFSEDSEDSNEEMMEEEDDNSEGDSDRSVAWKKDADIFEFIENSCRSFVQIDM